MMQDGVEGMHHIHLKHHLIKVDIQNNLNTMDHCFAATFNRHDELMTSERKTHCETKNIKPC
jgi:hypothetical protein